MNPHSWRISAYVRKRAISLIKLSCLLACLQLLMPLTGRSQTQLDPCPVKRIYANSNYIGLSLSYPFPGWVDGTYTLLFFSEQTGCFLTADVSFSNTTNFAQYFPAVTTEELQDPFATNAGIIIDISAVNSCNNLTTADIRQGATILNGFRGNPQTNFLSLTLVDGSVQECIADILPVTFTSFTATLDSSARAVLNWTTANQSDIHHFSIEKMNSYTSWKKIAEVLPGAGGTGSYSWTDPLVTFNATYRIIEVSNKCVKTISPERYVANNGMSTFTAITADCGPFIKGKDTICTTGPQLFYLANVRGQQTVTWTVTPSTLGTVKQMGLAAVFTPAANAYNTGYITATLQLPGGNQVMYKNIKVGKPNISVSTTNTYNDCGITYGHTATINPISGTTGANYSWYAGWTSSTYIGTGLSKYWNVPVGQTQYYQIRFTSYCGVSIYNGSSSPGGVEVRQAGNNYTLKSNFVRGGNINVALKLIPPCPQPPGPDPIRSMERPSPASLKPSNNTTIDIKVYDMYGNVKKVAKVAAGANQLTVHAPELPSGWYYLHITEPGKGTEKHKIWIER